jgi:hypothetical protein
MPSSIDMTLIGVGGGLLLLLGVLLERTGSFERYSYVAKDWKAQISAPMVLMIVGGALVVSVPAPRVVQAWTEGSKTVVQPQTLVAIPPQAQAQACPPNPEPACPPPKPSDVPIIQIEFNTKDAAFQGSLIEAIKQDRAKYGNRPYVVVGVPSGESPPDQFVGTPRVLNYLASVTKVMSSTGVRPDEIGYQVWMQPAKVDEVRVYPKQP